MADTIMLEGEAARALRDAARRAGYSDVARYAVSLTPAEATEATEAASVEKDGRTRGERFVRRLRGSGTSELSSDDIMRMTRGDD